MRRSLLSSASALALAAAIGQAHASPDMTGVLEVYGGAGWADQTNFAGADDPNFYGAKAKGYWPLSSDLHLQVDLFAQQTNNLLISNFSSSGSADATTH